MARRSLFGKWLRDLLASPGIRRIGRWVPPGLRRRAARVGARLDEPRAMRLRRMQADVEARLARACAAETKAWRRVRTREDWEAFLEPRLASLRDSLGLPARGALTPRLTRTLDGDRFVVDNLVFESRPGLLVTANMYRPKQAGRPGPGVLVCHGHHAPKSQVELQEIGAGLAAAGSTVLIIDQLGHGERRQHPFRTPSDQSGRFRLDRQDYYFRYVVGMQLQLVGESLAGWMVWDVIRGLDLLLDQPGVDADRLVLIGAVAGGGAIAAMAAALDPRVAAVVPFGFGTARNAAGAPLFCGKGSWEPTRNLASSARDGFMPWTILAAAAPRRVVYAHEFAWQADGDPVWERLKKVFALTGVPHHLEAVHGRGSVAGRPPENTHCTNVGAFHRRQVYPILNRWLDLAVPREEGGFHRPEADLECLPRARQEPIHRRVRELGLARVAAARSGRVGEAGLRERFAALLGEMGVVEPTPVSAEPIDTRSAGMVAECRSLAVRGGIELEIALFRPPRGRGERPPLVVGLAQDGWQALFDGRRRLVARLVRSGVAVCLAQVRGCGRSRGSESLRGRLSPAAEISSSEQMLGRTLLASRLGDLRSILLHLRTRGDLDGERLALWGDSLAPANPVDRPVTVPLDADPAPTLAEPLGGLLALFGALFEDVVRAVYVHRGLSGYSTALEHPCVHLPADVILPGVLTVGDLCDLAAALAPMPLRLEGLVDGRNRAIGSEGLRETYRGTREAYRLAGGERCFSASRTRGSEEDLARWLTAHLTGEPGSRRAAAGGSRRSC